MPGDTFGTKRAARRRKGATPAPTPTLAALTLSASSIAENSAAGTLVGALQGTTSGSTLALASDAGGRFALSGGNVVAGLVSTDFETATSHSITVRETLAGASNSPRDTVLTITVTDVADTPPPTLLTAPVATSDARVRVASTGTAATFSGATSVVHELYIDNAKVADGLSYTPVAGDFGKRLELRATASNAGGSTSASAFSPVISFFDNFSDAATDDRIALRAGWSVMTVDSRLFPYSRTNGIAMSDGFSPSAYPFAGIDLGRSDGGFFQITRISSNSAVPMGGFYYNEANWVRLYVQTATRLWLQQCLNGVVTNLLDTAANMATSIAVGDVFRLVLTYSGGAPRFTIQRNGVNFPQQSNYSSGTAPTFPIAGSASLPPLNLSGIIGSHNNAGGAAGDDFTAGLNSATPLPRMTMKSVRLYQRGASSGTRSIPVGGDAYGITGVEMRLLQNGAVVSGWDWGQKPLTNVQITATQWFADTAQVPAGDNYIIECRATNDTSAFCKTRIFAVGDIFAGGGQSNGTPMMQPGPTAGASIAAPSGGYAMNGPKASTAGGTDVGAYIFPEDVQFCNPAQSVLPNSNAGAYLAGVRAGSTPVPVMTVPFGLGSSNMASFLPGSTSAPVPGGLTRFQALIKQLNALYDPTGRNTTTIDLAGINWSQGEEDAGRVLTTASFDATAEAAYRTNIVAFYAAVRAACPGGGRTVAECPLVWQGLNRLYTTSSATQAVSPGYTRFRRMQEDICATVPGFFFAGSNMDLQLADTATAQPHYTGTAYIEQSYRAGFAMARAKGWLTKDRRGPIPISAVVNGSAIDVTFDLQSATSLTKTATAASQFLFATSNAIDSATQLLVAANQRTPSGAPTINAPSGGLCVVSFPFSSAPSAGWAMQMYGGANPQNVVGSDPNAIYGVQPTSAGYSANVMAAGAFNPIVVT